MALPVMGCSTEQSKQSKQSRAEHLCVWLRIAAVAAAATSELRVNNPHRVGVYNARAETKQCDRCKCHRGREGPFQRSRVATRAVNRKSPAASTALCWQSLWPLGNGLVGAHAFRTAVLHGLPLGTTEYPSKQGTRLPG